MCTCSNTCTSSTCFISKENEASTVYILLQIHQICREREVKRKKRRRKKRCVERRDAKKRKKRKKRIYTVTCYRNLVQVHGVSQ